MHTSCAAQAIRPNADPSKNAGWVKNEWGASRLAIDEGLGSWDKPWASRCLRGSKDLGFICSPLLEIWWSTGFWGCSIFGHDLEIVASNPGFPVACVLAGLMQICHSHRQCALWETARVFGKFTAVISPLVCWSAVGGFFAPSDVLAAVLVHQYKRINDTGRLEALMLKVFYHIFLGIYNLSSRRAHLSLPRWTRTSVWFFLQDRLRASRHTICVCCGAVTRWFDLHHASSAAWKFVGRGPGLRQADWDHGCWWSPVCAWHCWSQQRLTSIRSHVCWATWWDSTLTGVLVGPHVCAQSDMYGHGAPLFFLNWMIW